MLVASVFLSPAAAAFDFGDVMQIAGEMAGRAYKPRSSSMPDELRKLGFAQLQSIRYKPERNLWHRSATSFEISLVHMGMSFDQAVTIHEISSDGNRRLGFSPELFDYGQLKLPSLKGAELGFAGFRVHFPLNDRERKDEVVVFLGASYFRAVAEGLRYGLAARGLAVDTGEASGEEFPRFVEFWINRPSPGDRELVIFALLDSRRVTGAYRFVLRPGAETRMDVRARLFLRDKIGKLGIAPLTSMFLLGENQPPPPGAARPEVHDSDGLSVQAANGEWIWRPLQNPRRLLVTSYALTDPAGFGLLQRDRAFRSYEDLDARYDLRPSAWVTPKGKWGQGRVELVQIPSPDDTNDNIVAYWVPASQPEPRKPLDIEYQLSWGREISLPLPPFRVAQTRRIAVPPGERKDKAATDRSTLFVIDFEPTETGKPSKEIAKPAKEAAKPSKDAAKAPADAARIPSDATPQWNVSAADNGEILERSLRRHEATGGWRATLRVRQVDEKRPVELRGQLNAGGVALSEVWSYIVPPE